ncbi:cytoskeleton associated protein, putative [Leishmania tarentolae]|uniref:Cytoskeleton associated protein, putative n=1 Tax=Leishmania tarentolae TaxID=5689 RepID=A0A640KD07_LEITA|nr:cytoskeleton associated protein, putative [Leishmania tarentolae]
MSLFGEPLPFEDDTATSLIRRAGFPPDKMYAQMPEVYLCPCCSEFSKQEERDRLLREAREAKEAERRRLMQLDVFEERARPLPSGDARRKAYRRVVEEEPTEMVSNVPPPPQTIDDLRRAKRDQKVPKLVVTVHCGRQVSAEPDDRISVIVRCGAFEGQTEKVLRGREVMVPWEELFEFPYINSNEPLEVLVVNDALPEKNDQVVGGVVVPCTALHDRNHGDQEPLPIMPEDSMQNGYGSSQEGPLGTIVVSWYLRRADDKMDEEAIEQQTLSVPLGCTFVVHHLYQYTDHGAEPYTGGVLCVLRDTDDNCSESVLYNPGTKPEPSVAPYYPKEGYYYLPGNPSQVMRLNTERKLGHILVCVPKQEESSAEEEELLVIGAVPLEFERLYTKGSAVLLIESKSKEDALWGEITVEWANKPLDDVDPHPTSLEAEKESLFFTIVRGVNLVRRDGEPVAEGYVSVGTGELEGTTVEAPATQDSEGNNIISWNQEVRFIEVDPAEKTVEVQVYEKERLICVGTCELDDNDEGVVIVQMYHAANLNEEAGEIVGSYKRLHAPRTVEDGIYRQHRAAEKGPYKGADEEDEEQEELHQATEHDESNVHGDEEEEEEQVHVSQVPPTDERAMSINEDLSEEEKGAEQTAPYETQQRQRSEPQEQESKEDQQDVPHQQESREEEQLGQTQREKELQEGAEQQSQPERTEEEENSQPPLEEMSEEVSQPRAEEEENSQPPLEEMSEEVSQPQAEEEENSQPPLEEMSEEVSQPRAEEEENSQPPLEEMSEEVSQPQAEEEENSQPPLEEMSEEVSQPQAEEEDVQQSYAAQEEAPEPKGEEELIETQKPEEKDLQRSYAAQEEAAEPEEEDLQRSEAVPEEEEYAEELQHEQYEVESAHAAEAGEFDPREYHTEAQSAGRPSGEEAAAYTPTSGKPQHRRRSWAPPAHKGKDYKQPWYPCGSPETDQHVPFSKTNLSKKNLESIRQLETYKSRIEEESVRRGSTPRRSSARGQSPSFQ